jgi:2,5-dioxopentanoate dehydrogenase
MIMKTETAPPPSCVAIPVYVNLGNLTPGMAGSISATAHLYVNSTGYFKVKLHDDGLDDVFSNLTVVLDIGGRSVTLNLKRDEATVNLAPGNYTVTVTIYYVVNDNPHGPPYVVNKPLITVTPIKESEGSPSNQTETESE